MEYCSWALAAGMEWMGGVDRSEKQKEITGATLASFAQWVVSVLFLDQNHPATDLHSQIKVSQSRETSPPWLET